MADRAEITGVILAAGRGTRMSRLDTDLPKVVLPILNVPIVCHQLEIMERLGIKRVFIVVGYNGHEVVRHIERYRSFNLEIEYKHQAQTLGIAHSIAILEPWVCGPVLTFLGDVFFVAPQIEMVLDEYEASDTKGVLVAVREEDHAVIGRNYCIVTNDAGDVTRVIEKPRFPTSNLKGVGIYLFDPVVFDSIRRTPRTAMRDEYEITEAIQIMINDGYRIRTSLCISDDLNLTYPEDLLSINLKLLDASGADKLVASSAVVGSDVQVERSIIGAGAQIGDGSTVENSVVFADCRLPSGTVVKNEIVTEKGIAHGR